MKKEFKLYNGVSIPSIGFGTWQIENGESAYNSTLIALNAGYRHIDTAFAYGNEESIGKAIKDSGINRKEIFITSKVPADIKTYQGTLDHFYESLKRLDVKYLDLYLIHAPWPWSEIGKDCKKENIEVWKALIYLYENKLVRSIGVSNFSVEDIKNLIEATSIKPMVNQIRYFIGNRQDAITNYCQENDILIEAYSPLATGSLIDNEILTNMAAKYNVSVAKLCIAYCLANNTLPLPKSKTKERIIANLDVDVNINKEDLAYLNSLGHIGPTKPYRS